MSICQLFDDVACLPKNSELALLKKVVQGHPLSLDDVGEWVVENPLKYHRQPVFKGCGFQAWVLTWLPGQVSPIHDHSGSSCCLRVLQGTAIETVFEPQASGIVIPKSTAYSFGSVLAGEDADIHRIENSTNAAEPLITLHIYRPALLHMNLYEFNDGRLFRLSPAE